MPRIGNDAEPVSTQEWNGVNTLNQTALERAMPEAGRLTHVGMWAAARNNAVNARLCVWDGAGNLIARTAQFSMASRPFAVGENDNHYHPLETPIDVASGATLFIGISRDPAGEHQFGRTASGSHRDDTETGAWPGSLSGNVTDTTGEIGAYADYVTTPQNVWVRRSGAWVRPTSVRVRRSGAWDTLVHGEVKVRRSGGWSS